MIKKGTVNTLGHSGRHCYYHPTLILTDRAVSTKAFQSSLGKNRLMKSGLIGAGRSTSSTSEKTRGKLSFVQFSGKKKGGEKCELCKSCDDEWMGSESVRRTDMASKHVMCD